MNQINTKNWIKDLANYKRLLEVCISDKVNIGEFLDNPQKFLDDIGIELDVNKAVEAIKVETQGLKIEKSNYYIDLREKSRIPNKVILSTRLDLNGFLNQKFKAWYQRQRNWSLYRSCGWRKHTNKTQVYFAPISFELTEGCSGACPFCCLSPEKLKSCFLYSNENSILWNNILLRTKKILGEIAGVAACYFATEPFDNPDYEKFINHFHQIFGYYPHTTTVKSVDDISRTKAFLSMLGDENLKSSAARFSVTSKSQLEKIHKAFKPEEIAFVELTMNNPESIFGYTLAGRAVNLKDKLPDKNFISDFTSVCTIGFIVNMPNRTIKLITPRNSNTGMKVYEILNFTDEVSYENAIYKLISKWMPSELPFDKKIYTDNIIFEKNGNYLTIQGHKIHRTISISERVYKIFRQLLEGHTLEKALKESSFTQYERACTIELVEFLYDNGYIDIDTNS